MSQKESQQITIQKMRKSKNGEELSQAILDHARKFWKVIPKREEAHEFDGKLPLYARKMDPGAS
jgi:hypothetical protein